MTGAAPDASFLHLGSERISPIGKRLPVSVRFLDWNKRNRGESDMIMRVLIFAAVTVIASAIGAILPAVFCRH